MTESETREKLNQIIKRDLPGYELWNKQPITEKIRRIIQEPSVEELKQKYFPEGEVACCTELSNERTESPRPAQVEGFWPVDDVRRIFVEGAKWWEFYSTGGTMWQSDQQIAEDEADKRFPNGIVPPRVNITDSMEN